MSQEYQMITEADVEEYIQCICENYDEVLILEDASYITIDLIAVTLSNFKHIYLVEYDHDGVDKLDELVTTRGLEDHIDRELEQYERDLVMVWGVGL